MRSGREAGGISSHFSAPMWPNPKELLGNKAVFVATPTRYVVRCVRFAFDRAPRLEYIGRERWVYLQRSS